MGVMDVSGAREANNDGHLQTSLEGAPGHHLSFSDDPKFAAQPKKPHTVRLFASLGVCADFCFHLPLRLPYGGLREA